jgi:hypothetical protein
MIGAIKIGNGVTVFKLTTLHPVKTLAACTHQIQYIGLMGFPKVKSSIILRAKILWRGFELA